MANRLLGIELANDQIKIVEVGFGRRLKVFNFAVIDNRNVEPERRVEQFNHTLNVRGFEAKDALVTTSGGNVEHRLLTLPPLSGREMHFVMQRESKKLAPTGMTETLWSYEVLKAKEELGIKKNQILLVTAERTLVDNASNFLAGTRLKLQQVTTIPEAVLNLMRQSGAWKKDSVRTVIHFAGNLVHMMFVQDGVLLLSREVHFDATDMAQDEQLVRIISEAKRSIIYFRQNFPQAQLDQIVYSGGNELLGTLANRSAEELGIEGSIIRFEESLDTASFRGNWDEFRFHLPSLTAAFGAAWRKSAGVSGINLMPGKAQAKQQGVNPTKVAQIACAAALVVTLGAGGYYLREKGAIDADIADTARREAIVTPRLQEAADLSQQAAAAAEKAAFLKRISPRVDWTEMMRSLSFIVPDSTVFELISVREEEGQLRMRIRGTSTAQDGGQANADFNKFNAAVHSLPFFKGVSMVEVPKITFVTPPSDGRVALQSLSQLTFDIVCVLP